MAKDYAKNRSNGSGRSNAGRGAASRRGGGGGGGGKPGNGPGLLVGLMLGLAVGAAGIGWVWINRPAPPSPLNAGATGPAAKPEVQKPIALPPKQPSKYAFYEMLPSYEVVIPREDAAASAKAGKPTTPEIAEPGQYLIQVGSYSSRDEAERSRASLALLGVESRIEQVTIDQTNTWFRVRIGPQPSLAKAQEILQRLDENGIKGYLVKVKAA